MISGKAYQTQLTNQCQKFIRATQDKKLIKIQKLVSKDSKTIGSSNEWKNLINQDSKES